MSEIALVPISTLYLGISRIKIHARVLKIWDAKKGGEAAFGKNFVLIDDQAKQGAIQGFVSLPIYDRLPSWFVEGKCCEFSRFTVRASEKFRCVSHEFSLVFNMGVSILALPDETPLPLYYFDFKRLEYIGGSGLQEGSVLDVLVRLVAFGSVQNVESSGVPTRVRTIYVSSESGFVSEVALWEDFIDKFNAEVLVEESKVAPVIMAFSGAQVKEFRVMSLKTFGGTRVFFDHPIVQVSRFRAKMPSSLPHIVIHGEPLFVGNTSVHSLSAISSSPRRVSLCELANSAVEGERYECVAEIVRLNDHFGWFYAACPRCYRRVRETSDGSFCTQANCSAYNLPTQSVAWYRVPIQVSDGNNEAEFVLLGRQAEIVIGKTVQELLSEENPCEDDAPPSLLHIVGKRFLFTVRSNRATMYSRHRNFGVSRISPVPAEFLNMHSIVGDDLCESSSAREQLASGSGSHASPSDEPVALEGVLDSENHALARTPGQNLNTESTPPALGETSQSCLAPALKRSSSSNEISGNDDRRATSGVRRRIDYQISSQAPTNISDTSGHDVDFRDKDN